MIISARSILNQLFINLLGEKNNRGQMSFSLVQTEISHRDWKAKPTEAQQMQ